MAGKLTAAQGTGILLVTANVGSLFEDSPPLPPSLHPCEERLLNMREERLPRWNKSCVMTAEPESFKIPYEVHQALILTPPGLDLLSAPILETQWERTVGVPQNVGNMFRECFPLACGLFVQVDILLDGLRCHQITAP
ncbi:hypothetical protein NQZ68_012583 [Dissostichus eleginoides]|nr:hypothetical protein NQZ68_012583 [Dissostichus eleginoides]